MDFVRSFDPQYRDTEARGLVGVRGYINYIQDIITWEMFLKGLGSEQTFEKYGIVSMFTKCKLVINKEADFSGQLRVETGITKADRVRFWHDMQVMRGSTVMAKGRLEACLYRFGLKSLATLRDIEFPEDMHMNESVGPEVEFSKISKETDGMEKVYEYKVRYTDLDKSLHMNNLHYTELFLNALELGFYDENRITEFEIHYISQSYYGDDLYVYLEKGMNENRLVAVNSDDTVVAICHMTYEKAKEKPKYYR